MFSYSPAPNLASHARTSNLGKGPEKNLWWELFFSHPLLPSLSLSLKKKKCTSLSFCVWSAAWDIWQCGRVSGWLAGWLAGLAGRGWCPQPSQATGSNSRQRLRGERDRFRAGSCQVFAVWPWANENPFYALAFSSAEWGYSFWPLCLLLLF